MVKYQRVLNVLHHHPVVVNDYHAGSRIEKINAFHKIGRMGIHHNQHRFRRHHHHGFLR